MKSHAPIFFTAALLAAAFFFFPASRAFGYNPPPGSESVLSFASPLTLGGTANAAGGIINGALPGELTVNPALSAGEQRVVLDFSYAGLYGADDDSGYGNVINLGAVIPTSLAIFAGSLNFIQTPFDYALPWGTSFAVNASASKDLTEQLYVGAGGTTIFGSGKLGIAGSVGALYHFGDILFLKDLRAGVSVTGLGTAFRPDDSFGIRNPEKRVTGFPTPFTLRNGIAFLIIRDENVELGFSSGITFPRFRDLVLDFAAEVEVKQTFFAKLGWTFNRLEVDRDCASLVPTLALGAKMRIGTGAATKLTNRQDWSESELMPSLAYKYFDGGIHAVATGATLKLGSQDEDGPEIKINIAD